MEGVIWKEGEGMKEQERGKLGTSHPATLEDMTKEVKKGIQKQKDKSPEAKDRWNNLR